MGGRIPTEAQPMNCVICKHGETRPGTATLTLTRAGTALIHTAGELSARTMLEEGLGSQRPHLPT